MVRSYNNLYHGWINLYKDSGLTSNDALRLIKSIFKGARLGMQELWIPWPKEFYQ